jgi:hypothetical protein
VLGYQLIASGAGLVSVKDSTPATLAELQFAANALTVAYAGGHLAPAFETATGKDLVLGTQAAQDVNGHLTYVEVIA